MIYHSNITTIELRAYQLELAQKGADTLRKYGIVYYAVEVRCGKTLTALKCADLYGAKRVLFLTKKRAIPSILSDYNSMKFSFMLDVINDESMHKVGNDYDLVIHDEHHRFGSYPKPGKAIKDYKEKFSSLPMIFLSGTPYPESYSQIFHQFWVSERSPFMEVNFYKWFNSYGLVKTEFDLGYGIISNYSNNKETIFKYYAFKERTSENKEQTRIERSNAIELMEQANKRVMDILEPYFIRFTQQEAGFESKVEEEILYCDMNESTLTLINRLKKHRVIEGKSQVILADTPVKLMTKVHQLCSGTIKFESGDSMVIDPSKALFIQQRFKGQKIGIFYKFQAELDMLKDVWGDRLCTDVSVFDSTDKDIALQIVSGREGISLKNAQSLVFLTIDFSAISYWQARDRMATKDRLENKVYWIFANKGIERHIYNAVVKKKDYTTSAFTKGYGKQISD